MPTTSNFGWTTPADTDLVKDGAAAIRTLGNGIDTSFVDLKGGTTNQVLAKNSNSDLDFKWVADATGIPATIFDAKGDIIAATAADTADRLAVGTNGQVLTADSTTATGLKWAAVPSSSLSLSQIATGTLSGASLSVSSLSSYDQIELYVSGVNLSTTTTLNARLNSNTGTNYQYQYNVAYGGTATMDYSFTTNNTLIQLSNNASLTGADTQNIFYIRYNNCKATGFTTYQAITYHQNSTTKYIANFMGIYKVAEAISSIQLLPGSGTFSGGTYFVFAG